QHYVSLSPEQSLESIWRRRVKDVETEKFDTGDGRHVEKVDGDHPSPPRPVGLFALCRVDPLRGDLTPAARCSPEVHYLGTRLEQVKLIVDFRKLEGRAGAQPLPSGARHIGIVELAFQPQLGRELAAPVAAHMHLEIAAAATGFTAGFGGH